MTKPLILVTNDDSIHAPGIRALIEIVRPLGKVVVVAPDRPQSGTAHSITINVPLRLHSICKEPDYEEYSCNGTPVDCVKLAKKIVVKGKPDVLVSGINHGSNASINIIYSGTMAAVLESAVDGVPSIGFSLCDYSHDADFSQASKYIRKIIEQVMQHGLPKDVCLNVNIPAILEAEIKGIFVGRQARASWAEDFDERQDPTGRDYYWLKGIFINIDNGEDTDEWALENNYISLMPVQFDFTSHQHIEHFKKMDWSI